MTPSPTGSPNPKFLAVLKKLSPQERMIVLLRLAAKKLKERAARAADV